MNTYYVFIGTRKRGDTGGIMINVSVINAIVADYEAKRLLARESAFIAGLDHADIGKASMTCVCRFAEHVKRGGSESDWDSFSSGFMAAWGCKW
jgi:hypothetical protein